MKKMFFIMSAALIALSSCTKDKNETKAGIFKGPETDFYHGKAWTWVELNKEGNPLKVALSMTDAVLNNVPTDESSDHGHSEHVVLKFHPKADELFFKHIGIDWNPAGHPPANIYTKPHFDFHFYAVTNEERLTHLDPVKLAASLPADYLPANYFGGDPVPAMGKHYVDLTSPELNGQPFTETFIYGSYDAKLTFLEPMITLDFIKATTTYERSIPQPAKYQQSGYYPTKMLIIKTGTITNIILDGFVYRTAS